MTNLLAALGTLAASATLAPSANASPILVIGTGNLGGNHENVLFNDYTSANNSLTALTNAGTSVTFTGTEVLKSLANGQARISGSDGDLTALSWNLTIPHTGFQVGDFKLNPSQSGGATSVTITATDEFNHLFTLSNYSIPSSGFFNVQEQGGDLITKISIVANGQLDDVRQVRVGGVGAVGAVPEPSTWAMMVLGFAGLGFIGYRQRHRTTYRAA